MVVGLEGQKCQPCEGGIPPLSRLEAEELMSQLDPKWRLADDAGSLEREIVFKSFARAIAFLNRLADVAEQEGHHPDFCLRDWNRVTIALRTHAIGGLSLNDFILAAKLDRTVKPPAES